MRDNGSGLVGQEVARCMEQADRAEEVSQFIFTKTENIYICVCSQMLDQSTN